MFAKVEERVMAVNKIITIFLLFLFVLTYATNVFAAEAANDVEDEFEPDSFQNPHILDKACDRTLHSDVDIDYNKFIPKKLQRYSLVISDCNVDMMMAVFDPETDEDITEQVFGLEAPIEIPVEGITLTWDAQDPRGYVFAVTSLRFQEAGKYTIEVKIKGAGVAGDDDLEMNEWQGMDNDVQFRATWLHARPGFFDSESQSWGGLICNDNDWYVLWLPDISDGRKNAKYANGTNMKSLVVTITFNNNDGNLDLCLYRFGTAIGSSCSSNGIESVTYDFSVKNFGAQIWIMVYGRNGDTNPSYSMTVEVKEKVEVAVEDVPARADHGGGGGCFIATAAYSSKTAGKDNASATNFTGKYFLTEERLKELNKLRRFRDENLLTRPSGRQAVRLYYTLGPVAAEIIRDNEPLKNIIREFIPKIE